MLKRPRVRNEKHLAFIRGLPCLVCGDNTSTEAAHVRFSYHRAAKRYVGKAEKPDDMWVLPLCGTCHRNQHQNSEENFWGWRGRNKDFPIFVCLALWSVTGDHELGEQIIEANR